MRIIVVGAGAVGGVVAANLAIAGTSVVAVARGEHARVMAEAGLLLESPAGSQRVHLPVATSVADIDFTDDDIIVLGVKSQDTSGVLDDLRAAGVTDLPIVCMQNGVDNERQALRRFSRVYGMCVMLPADHLTPGVARVWTAPSSGLLDLGRYPHGHDDVCDRLATALNAATFSSIVRDDIMSWKYRKLLLNLGNAVEAVCGGSARGGRLWEMVSAEGEATLAASGIAVVSATDDLERRGDALTLQPVNGEERHGGSSWQSLERGVGTIETDYLTGEIVLLGRLHGVPTPANAALQVRAAQMARTAAEPGSHPEAEILRSLPPT